MTSNMKDKNKGRQRPFLGGGGPVTEEYSNTFSQRDVRPKELVPQIFSPMDLNLQREKGLTSLLLHWTPQIEILGGWHGKKSYLPLAVCPTSQDLSTRAVLGWAMSCDLVSCWRGQLSGSRNSCPLEVCLAGWRIKSTWDRLTGGNGIW